MRYAASLFLLFAASTLTACGGASSAGDRTDVVLTVNRNGWNEIWVMSSDGGKRQRLANAAPAGVDASGNSEPAWSPDGSRIAYVSTGAARREDERDQEIYVMNSDGTGKRRLTHNRLFDAQPSWSPDGSRITFVRAVGWGTAALRMSVYVMNDDGSKAKSLFAPSDQQEPGGLFIGTPVWSPSGDRIAFSESVLDTRGIPHSTIYVIRPNGTDIRLVVRAGSDPAWSPDGRQIAFASTRDRYGRTCFHDCGPASEIYVTDVSGQTVRRLTRSSADDWAPTWSPDGSQILFVSDRSNPGRHEIELYLVEADGTNLRRVTQNQVWDLDPDWRRS